jgi:hypothetical protein
MDHEKPEAVSPQILEYGDAAPAAEERRDRRGESLW